MADLGLQELKEGINQIEKEGEIEGGSGKDMTELLDTNDGSEADMTDRQTDEGILDSTIEEDARMDNQDNKTDDKDTATDNTEKTQTTDDTDYTQGIGTPITQLIQATQDMLRNIIREREEAKARDITIRNELKDLRMGMESMKETLENSSTRGEVKKYKTAIEKAGKALEDELAKNAQLEDHIGNLEGRIKGKEEEASSLRRTLQDISQERNQMKTEIERLQREVEGKDKEGREKDKRMEALEKELRRVKEKREKEKAKKKTETDQSLLKLQATLDKVDRKRKLSQEEEESAEKMRREETERPKEDRRKMKKIGWLGDSHIKTAIHTSRTLAGILQSGSEDLVRCKGGASLELLDSVDPEEFKEAEVMVVSAGSKEFHSSYWKAKTDNEREGIVTDIVEGITKIVKKFTDQGKEVLYIAPPIRRTSRDMEDLKLEEAMKRKEGDIKGLRVAEIGTKMKHAIERRGWKETMEDWLTDAVHMKTDKMDEAMTFYTTRYGWNLDRIQTKDVHTALQNKIRGEGKCTKCGERPHGYCEDKVYCTYCHHNKHDQKVCPVSYRPCLTCGETRRHERKDCRGWWE